MHIYGRGNERLSKLDEDCKRDMKLLGLCSVALFAAMSTRDLDDDLDLFRNAFQSFLPVF